MEDRYLYRKILSSAIVMALFATVVWIAGGMLGYYWNGLQGRISGLSVSWQAAALGMQGFVGSTVFYLLLIIPVIAFAILVSQGERGRRAAWPFQLLLIIPLFAYLLSAVFEVKKLKPIGRELLDIDIALDYAVYVPFALLGIIVALYMLLVIVLPASVGTRIFAIMAVLICGVCYIVYAAFIIYNHMMSMLGGNFTTIQFGLYLVCFACDAVAFYFMLSVFMTFSAIRREDRIPLEESESEPEPRRVEASRSSLNPERSSGELAENGGVGGAAGGRVPIYDAPAPERFEKVVAAPTSVESGGTLIDLPPEPENPKRLSGGRTGNDSPGVDSSSTVLGCSRRTPCEQTPPETVSDSPAPGSDGRNGGSNGNGSVGAKTNTKGGAKSNTNSNVKSNTKSNTAKTSGGSSKNDAKKNSGGKAKSGKSSK